MMMSLVTETTRLTPDFVSHCPEEIQRHTLVLSPSKHFPNFYHFMILAYIHMLGISMIFVISAINLTIHIDELPC